MDIVEFFNPYSVEHLKAYEHLSKHGKWPAGFLPENLEYSNVWQVGIVNKMANAWLEQAKAGHIFGMPSFDQ